MPETRFDFRTVRALATIATLVCLAPLSHAQTPDASCPSCDLAGTDFRGRILTDVNLSNANLSGADFSGATIKGVSFSGANLSGAKFAGATIADSLGQPTNMSAANLTKADFSNAIVTGADMRFANLSCVDFDGADLTGAALAGTTGRGQSDCTATLTGAKVSCTAAERAPWLLHAGAVAPGCPAPGSASLSTTSDWVCPGLDRTTLSQAVYVTSSGSDAAGCGSSPGAACKTISAGLSQCTGAGCGVLVGYGQYGLIDTVSMPSDTGLYGGCTSGSGSDDNYSLITAPDGGNPAIKVDGARNVTLKGLQVQATTASGTAGKPSIGVLVGGGSQNIVFDLFSIVGGTGAPGASGANATAGAPGGAASGRTAGTNASCNANGGTGGVGMSTHVDYNALGVTNCPATCSENGCNGYPGATVQAPGGAGGKTSSPHCELDCTSNCPSHLNAVGGTVGTQGQCGSNGAASVNVAGSFVNGVWTAAMSGGGSPGTTGGGGGGGGGGGACGYVCFWVPANKTGGNGGGGGAGGCGATAAGGGQQGGAAFAMQVMGSSVTLKRVAITGGLGGVGGKGGDAAVASSGGSSAGGVTPSGASPVAGTGGNGGSGGWGGSSGAGAGGNGGPAIGIVFNNTEQSDVSSVSFLIGRGGNVGAGGNGVTNPSGAPCGGTPTGTIGNAAMVANVRSFN